MQIGNMTKIIAQIINTKGGITNKGQAFFSVPTIQGNISDLDRLRYKEIKSSA